MAIITKAMLSEQMATSSFSKSTIFESSIDAKNAVSSVFLSHKHSDKVEVNNVYQLLKSLGANVYIDWLDPTMPKKTRAETGTIIKQKIKKNDKFILLATEAAIASKWCNWELGYGDSHKYFEKIALFPLRENYSDWTGSEYMGIYSVIEYENGNGQYSSGKNIPKGYYVFSPTKDGKRNLIPLKDWLQK